MNIYDTPIAHRGLHGDGVPENSMRAFALAIENGYNIELDVHLTRDGEVVVFHDDTLARVCGVDRRISDCTYDELSSYPLSGTEYKIPLLSDVLKLVDGRVCMLVEIKNTESKVGNLERETYSLIKKYTDTVAVQSFNPLSVKWYKDNAPEITRGILATGDYSNEKKFPLSYMLKAMWFNGLCKPEFIAYDERFITSKYLKRKRKGLKVLSWTISSPEIRDKVSPYVDNIIFEQWKP